MELAKLVAQYQPAAIWILFAWLLWWVMDRNSKREDKLMEHNKSLLGGFDMLKEEFRDLAASITGIDRRLENVEDEVKDIREKVG